MLIKLLIIMRNEEEWWWNRIPYKLECKEVENYDKVMGTNYLTIFYNLVLGYKQRLKKIISTIKAKSLRDINNNRIIFIIL